MKPGRYIGGVQRLTDEDMDRVNAEIRIQPSRFSGWYLLAAFACCCGFWHWLYGLFR